MRMLMRIFHGLWALGSIIGAGFRGVVTIMAFTEGRLMRQFSLSRRAIAFSCIVLTGLTVGSTLTLLNLIRGQYYLTRMQYLERENRAMTSLLQGQAEQLDKLKLEMTKLKEFEESVRQVTGLGVAFEPPTSESESSSRRGSSRGGRP
ncbi:MAG: hypothetical protein K8G79_12860 [bacterium]|uniref:Uncharacterized protein n=1 Tax=Candidatus Methylomirabilis tolerans TaxID=3123416 RepID=A0AAJ1AJS6_9BACT|nr:hypothetical protein [Candidatus Methylomirabilis sp.]